MQSRASCRCRHFNSIVVVAAVLIGICMCVCVWHWLLCKGAFGLGFFFAAVVVAFVGVFLYGKREMRIYLEGFKLLAPR